MMKFLVVIAAVALAAQAAHLNGSSFSAFKTTHKKSYANVAEEQRRAAIFESNIQKIEEHNARYAEGKETYKMAVNQFADLTRKEFADFLKMQGPNPLANRAATVFDKVDVNAPDSIDWRDQNAVTDVKNQGNCGSCWAFSTTGSLEAANFLKTGKLITLSEQQLVDCAGGIYGNAGCNGGLMESAFDYIQDKGITTEDQYPYKATDQSCKASSATMTDIKVTGHTNVKTGSEDALATAVSSVGPISVAVDATYFQFYDSGVFTDDSCGNTSWDLNHGVLAVGYASDHWIIKNSWGKSWGENGYIKLARNKNNLCGVSTMATWPLL